MPSISNVQRDTLERRARIRQLIKEGHTETNDVIDLMEKRYECNVSRETLYKDIKALDALDLDGAEKFDSQIISNLLGYHDDIKELVKKTSDPLNEAYNPATAVAAIRAAHQVAKDFGEVLDRNIRRQQDYVLKMIEITKANNPTQEVIRFIDSAPVVNAKGLEKAVKIKTKEALRANIIGKLTEYQRRLNEEFKSYLTHGKMAENLLDRSIKDFIKMIEEETYEELDSNE